MNECGLKHAADEKACKQLANGKRDLKQSTQVTQVRQDVIVFALVLSLKSALANVNLKVLAV